MTVPTIAAHFGMGGVFLWSMPYAVQTPVFEGPLDVLLHLITKQQVELYEVSISTIVDGFLAHLDIMQREAEDNNVRIDLETVTEFLLIASTLVQLKTQRLLPGTRRRRLGRRTRPLGRARPFAGPPWSSAKRSKMLP